MLKKLTAALLVSCMLLQAPVELAFASNGTDVQSVEAEVEEPENLENWKTTAESTITSEAVDSTVAPDDKTDNATISEGTEDGCSIDDVNTITSVTPVESGDLETAETGDEPVLQENGKDTVDSLVTDANELTDETLVVNEDKDVVVSEENSVDETDDQASQETTENKTVSDANVENTDANVKEADENEMVSETEDFNAGDAYEKLLSFDTLEEAEEYMESLTEEQISAISEIANEEDLEEFAAKLGLLNSAEKEIIDEAVGQAENYDNVAPFGMAIIQNLVPKMKARAFLNDEQDENGLILHKSAEKNDDGTYKITLEAYTTGQVTSSEGTKPCDIILVLDQSTSMESAFSEASYNEIYDPDTSETYYVAGYYGRYSEVTWCTNCGAWTSGCWNLFGHHAGTKYTPKTSQSSNGTQFYVRTEAMTRMEALQQAASQFVDQVADQEGSDQRIAVVGFGENARYMTGGNASTAFLNADTNSAAIKAAIDRLDNNTESSTEHGRGLEYAKNIFEANNEEDRQRVVVLFTDGQPAPSGTDNWSERIVKQAINNSYDLKTSYGAAVYVVSVMPGTSAQGTSNMDKYMNYISSNYPNARYDHNVNGNGSSNESTIISRVTTGTPADTGDTSFYLTAGDIDTLESIFEQIADQTGSATIQLNSSTLIQDYISDYFEFSEGTDENSIVIKTEDAVYADGALNWTNSTDQDYEVHLNNETGLVQVQGFDFNHNFVAENGRVEGDVSQPGNFHGRKLVISFDVKAKAAFLGGNQVPTNKDSSGVYRPNDILPVEAFEQPTVDVPIKDITVAAEDKHVYLMADLSAEDLKSGSSITAGDSIEIDPSEENFGLESWQNAFVNISVSADPAAGYADLTADQTYKVSCTISPKSLGSAEAKNGSGEGDILVYKPTVTFQDSEVWYGDAAPLNPDNYNEANYVDTVWKHGTETADAEKMTGTEPRLTFDYSLPENAFANEKVNTKEDIPVNVTAKLNNTDINHHTSFAHGACAEPDCGFNSASEKFLLHVNTCTLTIEKTGTDISDDPYVFTILKDRAVYTSASITGTGSITIRELPVGTYTVEEDEGWSWRYESSMNPSSPVVLERTNPDGEVVCTNTRDNDQWLNDYSAVAENVYGISHESASEGGNN